MVEPSYVKALDSLGFSSGEVGVLEADSMLGSREAIEALMAA